MDDVVTIFFKAIQVDRGTHQRTGREFALAAETRQAAVDELLVLLQVNASEVRIDPTRTLVQLPAELWTIVGVSPSGHAPDEPLITPKGLSPLSQATETWCERGTRTPTSFDTGT